MIPYLHQFPIQNMTYVASYRGRRILRQAASLRYFENERSSISTYQIDHVVELEQAVSEEEIHFIFLGSQSNWIFFSLIIQFSSDGRLITVKCLTATPRSLYEKACSWHLYSLIHILPRICTYVKMETKYLMQINISLITDRKWLSKQFGVARSGGALAQPLALRHNGLPYLSRYFTIELTAVNNLGVDRNYHKHKHGGHFNFIKSYGIRKLRSYFST